MSEFASQAGVTVPSFRTHRNGTREDFETTLVVPRGTRIPAGTAPLRIPCFAPCCTSTENHHER